MRPGYVVNACRHIITANQQEFGNYVLIYDRTREMCIVSGYNVTKLLAKRTDNLKSNP